MLNQIATVAAINAAHLESERIEKALIETAKNEDADMHDRLDACRQLGTKGSKASIAPLASLLNGDERVSHMACYALETNPDSSVDDALREALGEAKGRNLMGIMVTLGNRRDTKAIDAIAKHLGDEDKHVSAAAARALGNIGTEASFTALREAMRGDGGVTDRNALYEGFLRCARQFEDSNKEMAKRIYDRMQEGNAPDHVKHGAKMGAERVG
jgi:HEAT repeat protein